MDKNTIISVGAIISIIGFIMFLYGITSVNQLEERYEGYPYYIMPYPPQYEQDKTNYSFIGLIGFVLLISGIVFATMGIRRFSWNKSIYCTKCGFENNYEANFCKSCGNKL